MASITSTGVASGMDFESIIQSSLAVKKAQLEKQTSLKKEETNIELSGVGKLKGALNKFKTALEALKKDTSFNMRKFSSNQDEENPFFNVTTKSDATNCKFDVEVQKLASTEKITRTFANKDNKEWKATNYGTMTIVLGKDKVSGDKMDVSNYSSTNKDKFASFDIDISQNDTLETIRKKINKNDIGVTASIIHSENGDQLIIDTGVTGKAACKSKNNICSNLKIITNPNNQTDQNVQSNLKIFEFKPKNLSSKSGKNQTNGWTQTESTQAQIKVDGSTLVSDTNTFDKQISGIELTVNRVNKPDETHTLEVTQDIDGITKKVTELLDAYNSMMDTMDGLYKHDTYENGKNKYDGGELAGDSQLKGIQNALRNIMTSFDRTSTGDGSTGSGIDIYSLGVEVDKSGKFSLDSSKFKKGIEENFNAVVSLFTQEAKEVNGKPDIKTAGLIHRLFDVVDSFTKSDGVLSNREDALNDRIRDYEAKEADNAMYMEKYEENLRIRYSKLDITIGNANQSMMYMQSVLSGMAPPMGGAMI